MGQTERLPAAAADLLRANVDVIVTRGTAATIAAKEATRVVAIVFVPAAAPVEKRIVASLARPGGNVTGLALHIAPVKPLELLKEIAARATNVAHLTDRNTFGSEVFLEASLQRSQSQASILGVRLQSVALSDLDGVRSTYLHLIVCTLELQALIELVGEPRARQQLEHCPLDFRVDSAIRGCHRAGYHRHYARITGGPSHQRRGGHRAWCSSPKQGREGPEARFVRAPRGSAHRGTRRSGAACEAIAQASDG